MKIAYGIIIGLQIFVNTIVGCLIIGKIRMDIVHDIYFDIAGVTLVCSFAISLLFLLFVSEREDKTKQYYKLREDLNESIELYNKTSANLAKYINKHFKEDEKL